MPNYTEQRAREQARCESCKGLEECQYRSMGNKGFHPEWESWAPNYPTLKACKYRVQWGEVIARRRRYGESGLPERYKGLELKHLSKRTPPQVLEALLKVAEGTTKDLIIRGPEGAGKTALLSALGNSLLQAGQGVRYVTASELVMKLRFSSPSYEAHYERLTSVPYLLIDDLGSERWSEYNEEQLENVVNKRRRSVLTTVLTSTPAEYTYEGRLNEELSNTEKIELS